MDDAGNILVRRYSKSNVYVKSTANTPNEETAIGSDILKVPNHVIEHDKVTKVIIKAAHRLPQLINCFIWTAPKMARD